MECTEEKIAVIFIGTFFQQLVMFADVSAQVPNELFNAGYTLGASKRQIVTRVLLPATLPGVMDTLRVTMGWAWTYLVVAADGSIITTGHRTRPIRRR